MSLYADIGQGAGLAGASGVRPFLPPLLAGALARSDLGIDFDGTGWRFLESPAFLFAVFALAVLSYGAERSGANRLWLRRGLAALGLVFGALLFAGSLAEAGRDAWPGLIAGAACAALAFAALGALFERARARLDEGARTLVAVYGDGAALALALIAIVAPPLSYLALAGFVLLLLNTRRRRDDKYAGLRILR